MMYSFVAQSIGKGLVTLNGAEWKRHRSLLQPSFHPEVLQGYVDVMAEEAANYVDHMGGCLGRDVNAHEELAAATAMTIGRVSLSEFKVDDDIRVSVTHSNSSTSLYPRHSAPQLLHNAHALECLTIDTTCDPVLEITVDKRR